MKKTALLMAMMSVFSASAASTSMFHKTDTAFLNKAVMGNTFEIQAAQLAKTMAKTDNDRKFADQMITDHTKLGDEVKAAVAKIDPQMKLPTSVSSAQQRMLNSLKTAGKKFDRVYKTDMEKSHKATYALFRKYSLSHRANGDLKAVISTALPVV